MIAVVQRVSHASVTVGDEVVGEIGPGMVALVAVHRTDTGDDVTWMANKLIALRLFPYGDKPFDVSVSEAGGSLLLVSNFTVAARTQKGRRPSFDEAADPQAARPLFDELVSLLRASNIGTATGQFGVHMHVTLVNDGPVTVILDSRKGAEAR